MFLPNKDSLWASIYNIYRDSKKKSNQILCSRCTCRDASVSSPRPDQIFPFLLDFPQFISANIFLNLPSRPQP